MAEIKVEDLSTHNISGTDLFDDSENFFIELSTEDEANISGGTCYYKSQYNCVKYSQIEWFPESGE